MYRSRRRRQGKRTPRTQRKPSRHCRLRHHHFGLSLLVGNHAPGRLYLFGKRRLFRQKNLPLLHPRRKRHGPERKRHQKSLPQSNCSKRTCRQRLPLSKRRSKRKEMAGGKLRYLGYAVRCQLHSLKSSIFPCNFSLPISIHTLLDYICRLCCSLRIFLQLFYKCFWKYAVMISCLI